MIDFIKKYYLNILLVVFYTAIAMTVYIIWFDSMWHLWYVDLITGFVVFGFGCAFGYYYLKNEYKKNHESDEKTEIAEVKEDIEKVDDESGE